MLLIRESLFLCSCCGLYSSNIIPDYSMYDKSYLVKYQRYANSPIGRQLNRLRFDLLTRCLRSDWWSEDENARILDFGCGAGNFIKNHKNIVGFDINPYGPYLDVTLLLRKFTAVTLWDSLEHVSRPSELIKGLNSEYIFISTPNVDAVDIKNIHNWKHYYLDEHLHFYEKKSLKYLLNRAGYSIIDMNYDESLFRKSYKHNIITIVGKKENING